LLEGRLFRDPQGMEMKAITVTMMPAPSARPGPGVPGNAGFRPSNPIRGNAIRTSKPSGARTSPRCDCMGLPVINESFDAWGRSGDYGKVWDEWWQRDLDAMVLRDRNHPTS